MRQVIRQLARLRETITPQFGSHTRHELATRVIFSEQMPTNLERSRRIPIECVYELLLKFRGRNALGEIRQAVQPSGTTVCSIRFIRIYEHSGE
jgi:hypothetical protein